MNRVKCCCQSSSTVSRQIAHRTHQRYPSLISITQIKNDWHSFPTSCQESQFKLNRPNPTTLSGALCFFAKANKRAIKIQSITGVAALYHHLGGKAAGWRGGSSQQNLYDAFESVALLQSQGQRKLPGNSPWIVPSPGWGYNMHIHETEQLIPDCSDKALFHPAACFLDQKTTPGEFVRWVVQGHF